MATSGTVTQPTAGTLLLTITTDRRAVPVHVEFGVGGDKATADAVALRPVVVTDLDRTWTYQTETEDHTTIAYTAPV